MHKQLTSFSCLSSNSFNTTKFASDMLFSIKYLSKKCMLKKGSYPKTLKFLFLNSLIILKLGESLISSTLALYARPQTITVFLSFISSRDFSIEFAMYAGIFKFVLIIILFILTFNDFHS